ncbi:bis(5'-nucleosyl)-tetraphosphatase (symmetrical) YqeK [Ferroacidibacillus organovorans]|uniref:bis(5'-nucleosyl)-tetraphosphatase (symmetrical) n=2 Tax=Ferroacidibacillus organovorans TaxID=1765683 RepID=A0A1V4EXH2_9BACL|nr:bis(5'-nucleosyl)-tetraphosphatase (symmetrical) YqeK [Ferroacidibacillus organovorans]OPG17444.1 hypothetical protein B2M26_01555 [Ferroacidibacillus organovorans]
MMEVIKKRVQARLSPHRFAHVEGVAKTAVRLAAIHDVDEKRAELSAWLHDYYREDSRESLRRLAEEVGFLIEDQPTPLLHGPLMAARLSLDFGIDDLEVREAIATHTIGDETMGPVAQVLFVADLIEPGRTFASALPVRAVAERDLARAVAMTADATITHLLAAHLPIAKETVALRNRIWKRIDETT